MRACICDVCGKVEPMQYYGIPAHWISLDQRGEPPSLQLTGDDAQDFPKVEFEAACCSWTCVETLARRKQAEAEQDAA